MSLLLIALGQLLLLSSTIATPSFWEDFWSISCEFSGSVSRERRSAHQLSLEQPNFEDPDELFDFLYPKAKMGEAGGQRSMDEEGDGSKSSILALWWEDALDLWESECHSRHKRAAGGPRQGGGGGGGYEGGVLPRDLPNTYPNSSNYKGSFDLDMEKEEAEVKQVGTGDPGTTTPEPPPPPPFPAPEKDDATFFASYGGDIEYFFPLISFGIPFDGEITLLGFHGFKGLFPYK